MNTANKDYLAGIFMPENSTIMITGASSGIGQAVAVELAKCGFTVVGTARSEQRLEDTEQQIADAGGEFHKVVLDLWPEARVEKTPLPQLLKELQQEFSELLGTVEARVGGIGHLLNNAGCNVNEPFSELSAAACSKIIGAKNLGPLVFTQAAAARMVERQYGTITFTGSLTYHDFLEHMANYCGANGFIRGAAGSIAVELASSGVRVNSLVVGWMKTRQNSWKWEDEQFGPLLRGLHPTRREVKGQDLIPALLSVLSDQAGSTVGAELVVDGGKSLGSVPQPKKRPGA